LATEQIIDVEAILQPIAGNNPSGKDVRDGKDFGVLKEARRGEESLSQGDWKRDAKVADWPKAIQLATKLLTGQSKDLQVAAWLVEALNKRHGFAGLRDGLKILRGLHANFWDGLYPAIEDGDLEYRSGKLDALNKLLPFAVNNVPLVRAGDGTAYTYVHYKESQDVENLRRAAASDTEKRRQLEEAVQEGNLEGEKFDKAVAGTPLTHCNALLEQLSECWEAYEQLDQVLEEKYGEAAPSLRAVKDAVGECRSLMNSIVKKKGGVGLDIVETPTAGAEVAGAAGATATVGAFSSGIDPRDRSEALRRLAAVAEFFRKTEPHSPISYLVQRAARWGEMPLEEWLREVIKDDVVLGGVRETLGIKEASSYDASSERTS
jgi:type VI secretion system protein ImpA